MPARALSDAAFATPPDAAPESARPESGGLASAGRSMCARWAVQAPGRLAVVDERGGVLCTAPTGAETAWSGAVAGALPALVARVRLGADPVARVVPEASALLLARSCACVTFGMMPSRFCT